MYITKIASKLASEVEESKRIETILSGFDQPLPVDIDRFWPVAKNKIALQQLFTKWTIEKVEREDFGKSLFLGGSHKESDAMCYSIINSSVDINRCLYINRRIYING